MNIVIDIETIPDQRPGVLANFVEQAYDNFSAPSGMTKEQAAADLGMTDASEIKFTSKDSMLAKWCERFRDEKAAEVGEANWRKTSFDGGAGQIVCIGVAQNDLPAISIEGMNERELLQDLFCWLTDILVVHDLPLFVGHNIASFDLRFIWQRAMVLGVRPPLWLPRNPKPWDDNVFDTMTQWAGSGNRISLDNLCKALGVQGKTDGIDGSMVWNFVRDGRIDEVAAYCRNDVEITRQCFRRMTFAEVA